MEIQRKYKGKKGKCKRVSEANYFLIGGVTLRGEAVATAVGAAAGITGMSSFQNKCVQCGFNTGMIEGGDEAVTGPCGLRNMDPLPGIVLIAILLWLSLDMLIS